MTMQEAHPVSRELVGFTPSDAELMAGFVSSAGGLVLPVDEGNLAKGLTEAARQASFLERFVDSGTGAVTYRATAALEALESQGLLQRRNGNWEIPNPSGIVGTSPADQLNAKVRSIFKPAGLEMLKAAGEAANNAWWNAGA